MSALTQAQFQQVQSVFDQYGIPSYVWEPIMQMESGGDPNAHPNYGTGEDSRGLFQINNGVHPQYQNQNLYDPVTNATIAARDFISPAYQQAMSLGLSNPGQISDYVWKNGIKPNWSQVVADGKDVKLATLANQVAGGQPILLSSTPGSSGSGSGSGGSITIGKAGEGSTPTSTSWTDFFNPQTWKNGLTAVAWVVVGIVLIAAGLFVAFNPEADFSKILDQASQSDSTGSKKGSVTKLAEEAALVE